ncbi:hypothetical protein K445DRAFT_20724 [Daldinia sp. EC12]|nr:hypothetical protein K445DRAFT_20724 [Daldinia sp. EC12]
MSYPRHEAELDRRSLRNCLHIFDHSSEILSLLRSSWHQTRDYYAARDVLDLERAELIQIISYSRTMGGYIYRLMKDYPEEITLLHTDRKAFRRWLRTRMDSNVFQTIYGARIAETIDYRRTFANRTQLPCWYLKQIFCVLACKLCEVIEIEMVLNPGLEWSPRYRKGIKWNADYGQRNAVKAMFDDICKIKKFGHVELSVFTWAQAALIHVQPNDSVPQGQTFQSIENDIDRTLSPAPSNRSSLVFSIGSAFSELLALDYGDDGEDDQEEPVVNQLDDLKLQVSYQNGTSREEVSHDDDTENKDAGQDEAGQEKSEGNASQELTSQDAASRDNAGQSPDAWLFNNQSNNQCTNSDIPKSCLLNIEQPNEDQSGPLKLHA